MLKKKKDCKTNGKIGKCKTKAIPVDLDIFTHFAAYSGIFRHIQAYSAIIQACSESCATLTYSEPWYIQNPGIIKIRSIFRTQVYPKLWHIQKHRHFQNPGIFRTGGIHRTLSNIYHGALPETANSYN